MKFLKKEKLTIYDLEKKNIAKNGVINYQLYKEYKEKRKQEGVKVMFKYDNWFEEKAKQTFELLDGNTADYNGNNHNVKNDIIK
ncbi:hypothetical protein IF721_13535 (plasmid) [Staphylococcus aureus]|uniref:hypothetical protein n=1 Tax=Staphylococcus aureus TaxID=1280 RepID=UPI000BA7ADA3|nr:hypothetical protein [Staphylococcus aureus]EHS7180688.1 hypothetical protein [Staphylococcus pseudintermedius]PAJ50113.1 hypothetical protein APW25_11715 [Staphylococcus aureus]ULW18149.1 hypothetical protein IF721_13535 [Staphylococcus aureus]BBL19079.1 hypothetical protein SAJRA307_P0310 [Staphylococcus aureus]HAR6425145.1 hypothetical protein [Staphylococcus pseudintermedius]